AKSGATLRAKANLPWGVVARAVEYRRGYPPTRTPSPRANWPLANCILSQGLVSKPGVTFFQTTIPSPTLAWQLWLRGASNTIDVKKAAAPNPASYDLTQAGQMLVVSPYLAGETFNSSYFFGVSGAPGTALGLASRQQPIIPTGQRSRR
ncbi:MAG: hypothetical protein KGS61_10920, partial [Verrucomicrobia bacterium]|nr:hypothetical protein [Verrucomicrobiota bacterium]